MEKVAIVTCESYALTEVYLAVKEGLQTVGFIIPENKTVLIKPNIMSQNRPDQHTITHFAMIDALCCLLSENHCEILIGDSVSFFQQGLTRKAFVTSGIGTVADKYGGRLIAFEEEPLIRFDENLVGLNKLFIPKILLDVDLVINACKLKTHSGMRLSGAIKNMFGCLPGGYKQRIHQWTGNEFELADVFIDIHNHVKPGLSVMDAVVSLDGGPTALGQPVKTSRILVATNAAALDIVAAKMIGYRPGELPILMAAKKRGLIKSFDDLKVIGNYKTFRFKRLVKKDLFRRSNKDSIFVKDTFVNLLISKSRCTKCKKCVPACPVHAINAHELIISLDPTVCINCYYCLSICPENAIRIKSKPLNMIIRGIRQVTKL